MLKKPLVVDYQKALEIINQGVVPIKWKDDTLWLINQLALPAKLEWIPCKTVEETARAIKDMIVRGAPAIGVTAAYGMAIAAKQRTFKQFEDYHQWILEAKSLLASTRPTAVNLFWALEEMYQSFLRLKEVNIEEIFSLLLEKAQNIQRDDQLRCFAIGQNAISFFGQNPKILTICNAGALATGGFGTALGVVRALQLNDYFPQVYALETRPYLQGARLTAWELNEDHIPVTLVTDGMAGTLLAQNKIDAIITGADRIAKNGDTANKIGTYQLAVLAYYHKIPFYVAAPLSTIDFSIESGKSIVIEERPKREMTVFGNITITPESVNVYNPAFDITPAKLITSIITERGSVSPQRLQDL